MVLTKIISPLRSATMLLTLAISTLLSPANLGAQTDQTALFAGSWILTIPGAYTDSGNPERSPITLFPGGGGILVEKPNQAVGVVAWKQTGDRQFAFTIIQIHYSNDSSGNNNRLFEDGTIKIKGVATLNDAGDSLTLTVSGQYVGLDGNAIDSFSLTVTAARVQVESL